MSYNSHQFVFTYRLKALGHPEEIVEALDSAEARRVYAAKHGVAEDDVTSKRIA